MNQYSVIRAAPGSYALTLFSSQKGSIQVGRLGQLSLERGYYLYVGSARGPGGVKARIAHHQKVASRPHWHIDYLRAVTRVDRVWCTYPRVSQEHRWARLIRKLPGAQMPLAGFGSSDCRCRSHLYFFKMRPAPGTLKPLLVSLAKPG